MANVISTDPRSGEQVEVVAQETTRSEVDRACEAALKAAPALEQMGRAGRSALLRVLADALESQRLAVVGLADRETGLGEVRLQGELTRTTFQLRLFSDVLDEGSYLEAAIDHEGASEMGPDRTCAACLCRLARWPSSGPATSPLLSRSPVGTRPPHLRLDARWW